MESLNIHERFRIRPAGWKDGEQVPLEEEIALYQRVESPFVEFRDKIEDAGRRCEGTGTNEEIQYWVDYFRNKGGHVSRLAPDDIQYIMEHGLVVFLELKIREGIYTTFGSVSALSAIPTAGKSKTKDGDRSGNKIEEALLGSKNPNLELIDVGIPYFHHWMENPANTLYICRSSILANINRQNMDPEIADALPDSMEGLPLQRHGFASRGKYEIFSVAERNDNHHVMMNIGVLTTPDNIALSVRNWRETINQPSFKHNNWLGDWGWRLVYRNHILLPEDRVTMYWMAFREKLKLGREVCLGRLKKWNQTELDESVALTNSQLQQDIEQGRHAPWGGTLSKVF
ncbi:MAG: hypothetical protein K9M03_04575 [Kiritimatiellales bacterium]|nr:hypothetical protein [Kiritimatiellales bacterium]